jgi:mannose-6-phosphate isomerase-like protein (cupin superfamily)
VLVEGSILTGEQVSTVMKGRNDMRRIISLAIPIVFLSGAGILGQSPTTSNAVPSDKVAVIISAAAIKWVQARPGQDSSVLWGDPRSGAFGRFNRFVSGFEDRRHYHTRDLHAVTVAGTVVVQIGGEQPVEMGPGSYQFIPGGMVHTHSCKAGAACVIFVQQDGPNDSVPVDASR